MSGPSLVLDAFGPADTEQMVAADRDPEHRLRFEVPEDFEPDTAHALRVIERWERERANRKCFVFAVRDAETQELLAGVELRPRDEGPANLAYWTYPQHRRRGIATRAVRLLLQQEARGLGITEVEACVDEDNTPSQRVALACGLKPDGRRGERLLFSGRVP